MMLLRLIIIAQLLAAATGCQTARFYSQAVGGQWEIVMKRKPIERVLAKPEAPEALKQKLRLVRELCAFAEQELHLPARNQFTRYADLERPFVVWNIHAAPPFSFEPKSWWYPFVGRLEYQGYFKRELAADYARRLREQGLDVFAGGVTAYSTLGWFDDPVLNTFVDQPESDLADLIFHELAHKRVFIAGDTDFNEAFATAVAHEGVRRWLEHKAEPEALLRYQRNREAEDKVVHLILAARDRLRTLYTSPPAADALARGKAAIIAELRVEYAALKQRWPDYEDYDDWMAAPINNAQINTVDTYYELVPGFGARLDELNRDLQVFYREVEAMRRKSSAQRRALLAAAETRGEHRELARGKSAAGPFSRK